jgi:hypothetical protein
MTVNEILEALKDHSRFCAVWTGAECSCGPAQESTEGQENRDV